MWQNDFSTFLFAIIKEALWADKYENMAVVWAGIQKLEREWRLYLANILWLRQYSANRWRVGNNTLQASLYKNCSSYKLGRDICVRWWALTIHLFKSPVFGHLLIFFNISGRSGFFFFFFSLNLYAVLSGISVKH